MQLNKNQKNKSRCLYCNQLSWGKGCRYAPHGVHFHADIPTLCAYCGNPAYGVGCHVNPTGNIHIHGADYNNMFREGLQSYLTNAVLLKQIQQPYSDFNCCRLGIIDKNGNKLREPITEEEKKSYCSLTKTVLRLKKYLGPKIDLIQASSALQKESIPLQENLEEYKKLLEFKDKFESSVNELYKVIDEACLNGLSFEDVQKIIKA